MLLALAEDRPLATRVILVRHGESSFNVESRVQGHLNVSNLTSKGFADAKLVGKALLDIHIDAFYHSPLTRAQETARNILETLTQNGGTVPARCSLKSACPSGKGFCLKKSKQTIPSPTNSGRLRPICSKWMCQQKMEPQNRFTPSPHCLSRRNSFGKNCCPTTSTKRFCSWPIAALTGR
jgi:bisphosphoglycerate-dependent phosphoglycerate mutase